MGAEGAEAPLLVRAARGEKVERPPVWMMRQAGRYMKVYQELAKKHPSFRERSENADLSTEISLQPWEAFSPDGVILFSDILTPLPGMGVGFDIPDKGPVIDPPLRTKEDIDAVHEIDPTSATPFVGETLRALTKEVDGRAAVLGFIGAPYTLATYCIEGLYSVHCPPPVLGTQLARHVSELGTPLGGLLTVFVSCRWQLQVLPDH